MMSGTLQIYMYMKRHTDGQGDKKTAIILFVELSCYVRNSHCKLAHK
jgi:hypothetical protein